MPCYYFRDLYKRPPDPILNVVTKKGAVYWPDLDDVRLDFDDAAYRWDVTEEAIVALIAAPLSAFTNFGPNMSHPADYRYRTPSTIAAMPVGSDTKLEIALRQDLSDPWMSVCNALSLEVPRCLVFHAMYKPLPKKLP